MNQQIKELGEKAAPLAQNLLTDVAKDAVADYKQTGKINVTQYLINRATENSTIAGVVGLIVWAVAKEAPPELQTTITEIGTQLVLGLLAFLPNNLREKSK